MKYLVAPVTSAWTLWAAAHCDTLDGRLVAADRSLETGKPGEVAKLISQRIERGLHGTFDAVMRRLYEAADTLAPERVQKPAPAPAHTH